jgi:hypothetical protein
MKLIFADKHDIHDPVGQIRYGANSLEFSGNPAGIPDLRVTCPVKQDDGSYLVYGLQNPLHAKGDGVFRIFRFRTYDAIHYIDREVVYESEKGSWIGNGSIIYNPEDKSFLCLQWLKPEKGHAVQVFASSNGADWKPLYEKHAYYDHDSGKGMFDAEKGEYVVYQATYQNHPKPYEDNCYENMRRTMHIRTSKDGKEWTPSDDVFSDGHLMPDSVMITPDSEDPPELEFYDFAAFKYQDRYVGMMQNYAASPRFLFPWRAHGPHLSTEWWISRDGRSWQRPYRDLFAAGPAPWIIHTEPMTINNRHHWLIKGGIYSIPEDRIFYTGALANASFTTELFEIKNVSCPIKINASLGFYGEDKYPGFKQQRYLTAELLDEKGEVIPGYEVHLCTIKDLTEGYTPLWWYTSSRMKMEGRKVKIRFYLRDARIYSIEVPE